MKISSYLCNLKSVISAFLVIIAIVGLYNLVILREIVELPIFTQKLEPSTVGPHLTLSGLNCSLEAGVMSVKTTSIWDSKVVKVIKAMSAEKLIQ